MLLTSLVFKNLSFQAQQDELIFDQANFEFPMQSVCEVLGPLGCGKSILLKILSGLVPFTGEYLINEQAVQQMSFQEFLPYRLKIGYAFDSRGLLANKTVRENLLLPLQYHKLAAIDEAKEKVSELLSKFLLQKVADLRPADISSNSAKLALLARSLIFDPEVLLLDSPCSGLAKADKEVIEAILLQQLQQQALHSIFYISEESFLEQQTTQQISIRNSQLGNRHKVDGVA